jgi:putative spermidine/putrescine transport system ATP-binding protein
MFRDSTTRATGELVGDHVAAAQSQGRPVKLRISGVSKKYGDTFALRPSDLDIQQGEFVTLLGPSGSGKTTLLMMIAGLVHPTAGDIWIDGRKATRQQPYERDVGMMFQSYALFPHMTVGENIAFPLKMRRASQDAIRTAVDDVLQQIKLPHVRNRFPSELSGGQQQRVALARSIVHRPSVVLMDEPLAALDKSLRAHMQLEIRQLQQQLGITVLYVTHDQEEAMTMSDRICLMNEARIEQVASPAELYFSPRTVFAAGFVGESNSWQPCAGAPPLWPDHRASHGHWKEGRALQGHGPSRIRELHLERRCIRTERNHGRCDVPRHRGCHRQDLCVHA